MIRPTVEILKEALDELTDTIDYVCSESGDTNISKWLHPPSTASKITSIASAGASVVAP